MKGRHAVDDTVVSPVPNFSPPRSPMFALSSDFGWLRFLGGVVVGMYTLLFVAFSILAGLGLALGVAGAGAMVPIAVGCLVAVAFGLYLWGAP